MLEEVTVVGADEPVPMALVDVPLVAILDETPPEAARVLKVGLGTTFPEDVDLVDEDPVA